MEYLEKDRSRSAPELVGAGLRGRLRLRRPRAEWAVPAVIALVILVAWEAAARLELISALIYPAPSTIAAAVIKLTIDGRLPAETASTLRRLFAGVLLGGVPGVLLGLLMGWSRRMRLVLDPFVAALHPIPKIAVLPLIMVILGVDEAPKIAVAATGAFFPMLVNTMEGVRQIHPIYFEIAQNYGASPLKLIRRVIWPASLPHMLTGLRLALNVTLLLVVAVEMVSARQGLGAMMWLAWELMRSEHVYAALLVVIAFGLGFNALIYCLTRLLVPWHPEREL
jgi:NitT/TauT family transport system permease protein